MKPVTPDELELSADPEETAESHEAIAVEKAVEWSRLAGMLAIASDGGLVVPSLGDNWESRYTHRFAGPAADDNERRRRLLHLLENADGSEREASWVEALAIAGSGRPLKSWALTGGQGIVKPERLSRGPTRRGSGCFPSGTFPNSANTTISFPTGKEKRWETTGARLKGLVQEYFVNEFSLSFQLTLRVN